MQQKLPVVTMRPDFKLSGTSWSHFRRTGRKVPAAHLVESSIAGRDQRIKSLRDALERLSLSREEQVLRVDRAKQPWPL